MTARRLAGRLAAVLLAAGVCGVALLSLGESRPLITGGDSADSLETVFCQTAQWSDEITLPHTLEGLPPRAAVTLSAEVDTDGRDSLLIKSVFSPARVYLNGNLAHTFGEPGSYPLFFNDPPTGLAIISLPPGEGTVQLRVEYRAPTQRSGLRLPTIYTGSEGALLRLLIRENGLYLLFALILLLLGAAMTLAAVFLPKGPSGSPFLWLGLFSLSTGAWVFGECDLSALLLPRPSLLYMLDYLGLFCLAIPFLRFGMTVLQPKNKLLPRVLLAVQCLSLAGALALQFTGAADLMRTLYWFHIITPLSFLIFAAHLLWELLRHGSRAARRFAPAMIPLALSAVLELVNYWAGIIDAFTVVFQVGLLLFIIWLGVISGLYVRDSMRVAADKLRLELEVGKLEQALGIQRQEYARMTETARQVRALRHDMRHQLAVIRAGLQEPDRLKAYLSELEAAMPAAEIFYCDHFAVNAVAGHYLSAAAAAGAVLDVRLDVPQDAGALSDADLCIVVGNLLENAAEAVKNIPRENRRIKARARVDGRYLSLMVENPFDGGLRETGGRLFSRKRERPGSLPGEGVGLPSVKAVCEKYGGMARFTAEENVFRASAILNMRGEPETDARPDDRQPAEV